MRRLVVAMAMSVDGLVARPARLRAAGWGLPPEDPGLKQHKLDWFGNVGLHLMGRNTYEEMASFWPTSSDPYASPMNTIPKLVFSKTLERADWERTRIARGELVTELGELKRGGDDEMIAWGGAAFVQSLSNAGLVDEYRLTIEPVALGDGLPLFSGLNEPLQLELIDARTYATGSALHVYRPTNARR